jgi:hypothetical protein
MHAPEYTAQIKALIAAKDETEACMKRALYQFRNGRKPNPDDIADAKRSFAAAIEILEGRSK